MNKLHYWDRIVSPVPTKQIIGSTNFLQIIDPKSVYAKNGGPNTSV
jgi:hypothetical protein